jgi:hypothetical protein
VDTTSKTIHRPRAGRKQPGDRGDGGGDAVKATIKIAAEYKELTNELE